MHRERERENTILMIIQYLNIFWEINKYILAVYDKNN